MRRSAALLCFGLQTVAGSQTPEPEPAPAPPPPAARHFRCAGQRCVAVPAGATKPSNETWFGTSDCNEQCHRIVKYGCNQENVCAPSATGIYFEDDCNGICDAQGYKWMCQGGNCVESDSHGNYSDAACDHKCEGGPPPSPPPPRYSCSGYPPGVHVPGLRKCIPDESGISPYFFKANCDDECDKRPLPPSPGHNPSPHGTTADAAHVVLVIVLVLIGLGLVGTGGFFALKEKRKRDALNAMGPSIGDPLMQ